MARLSATNNRGFSLIEVIIAVALFGLFATALIGLLLSSSGSDVRAAQKDKASWLAQSGMEAVSSIRRQGWNYLLDGEYGLANSSGHWEFAAEPEVIDAAYTRRVTVASVCRDSGGQIVGCEQAGATVDLYTKQATVSVSYDSITAGIDTVTTTTYLTNWQSLDWTQTDWSAGSGQGIWSNQSAYESDSGTVDFGTIGEVKLQANQSSCGAQSWSFDQAGDYTYNSGEIQVSAGKAALVEQAAEISSINDSVIDRFEFDTSDGREVDVETVTDGIYAIAYRGQGSDGFIKTLEVASNGDIVYFLGTREFDTSDGAYPDLIKIGGNVFAVAYQGPGGDGFIKTVTIANDGSISNVISTFEFDTQNGGQPAIIHVAGDIYAIAYQGQGSDGYIKTVTILPNGVVTPAVISTYVFDGDTAEDFDIIQISAGVFAIAYRGSGADGYVATVGITTLGAITGLIDSYEYDPSRGLQPSIVSLGNDLYAIAYSGPSSHGTLISVAIDADGTINGTVDSFEFDSATISNPSLVVGSSSALVVAYTGSGSDGFVKLIETDQTGQFLSQIDSLEFDTSDGGDPSLLLLSNMVGLIAYTGSGADGFAATIGFESQGGYPVTNPSINPNQSYTVTSLDQWVSFTETATKNGGEIYYQLSDDNGANWYYYNGVGWTVAGQEDYNIASEVDKYLWRFPTGQKQISFRAFLASDGNQQVELDEVRIGCAHFQYEVGQVTAGDAWTTVDLVNSYDSPVVVATARHQANTIPVSVRFQNVAGNQFQIKLQHPGGNSPVAEQIDYFVIEEGKWDIGVIALEARKHVTATVGSSGNWLYDTVNFHREFSNNPVVLHTVNTNNDSAWIGSYISSIGSQTNPPGPAGFQIGLDGAQVTTTHGAETIGWVAFDSNDFGISDPVAIEGRVTSDTVEGHDNGCYSFNLVNPTSTDPIVIGSKLELDGPDGGWLMTCSKTPTAIGFHIEEDQQQDEERTHTGETVGYISFQSPSSFSNAVGGGGAYPTSGELTSSAFNTGSSSSVNIIARQASVACSGCAVKIQIRTAPDSAGTPGVWTDWFGATGSGTFFTADQTVVPVALNFNQWIQYKIIFEGNGSATPIVQGVTINYTP